LLGVPTTKGARRAKDQEKRLPRPQNPQKGVFQGGSGGGQAALAKWKEEHPVYHSDAWHIQRYKCVPGDYKVIARHRA
jgi:hypothetical protein